MVNKNKIAYILALPKILQSSSHEVDLINTKLSELLVNDPDAHKYLSLVGVMHPEIDNKIIENEIQSFIENQDICLLYTSPSPRDATLSRMPSSA